MPPNTKTKPGLIRIAGAGCCLLDSLYPNIDFLSAAFSRLKSRQDGDGGLSPGRLSFVDELEAFLARSKTVDLVSQNSQLNDALAALTGNQAATAENIGGPAVVALIHAAQMLGKTVIVEFHGLYGDDAAGERLLARLRQTALRLEGYRPVHGATPSTIVLSDPRWDGGRGERCFINDIGVAALFSPETLGQAFFNADLVVFGGSALVPPLHDALPELLGRAQTAGALSVVNTVFDFRNERLDPVSAWPLGPANSQKPGPQAAYEHCDLLIADYDEALRLSGCRTIEAAGRFFMTSGVQAVLLTQGADPVLAWAKAGRFEALPWTKLAVSALADELVRAENSSGRRSGDTTGCGDAFVGGVLAAIAQQLASGEKPINLVEAAGWGIAAGAVTLFILGGVYTEKQAGEKAYLTNTFHSAWQRQKARIILDHSISLGNQPC